MRLTTLPLTPDNIARCRPLWGDRLALRAVDLDEVIRKAGAALRASLARGALFVDEQQRPRYFGLSAFIDERFLPRLLDPPRPQIGWRLLREWSPEQPSLLLDDNRIARANGSQAGLVLMVVNQGYDLAEADAGAWPTIVGTVFHEFESIHRGFRLGRVIAETFGEEGADVIVKAVPFADVWRFDIAGANGAHVPSLVFTYTRQDVVTHWSPFLPMFTYSPPRVLFTKSERALLSAALAGWTNKALAARLGVTVPAITARWMRIAARVADRAPELLSGPRARHPSARGEQVRHVILEFVRAHPSELTPYAAPSRRAPPGS